ncbi:MAG: FtsW/RodA/SpoVE family cell cycle protein [Armatimonadetes bacterium]|nr:FtsW/RodA/SpoVE family cell cycle protein [Armatimonadota bacterium]
MSNFRAIRWVLVYTMILNLIVTVAKLAVGYSTGSLSLVALFGILTWRGIVVAQRSRDGFGSLMALGILLVISGQAFLNMAVVTALAPTTGITLPLISYGGSSLVMSLFALGVLANISRRAPCPPEYLLTDETNSGPDRRRNGRSHLSGSEHR